MGSTRAELDSQSRRERVDGARLRLLERAATATLKDVLTATLDLAEDITGSQIGFFHFVEDDQTTLWLQAWSTNTATRMCTAEGAGSHYPVDRAGVWADCIRTGRPVVHDDYASTPGKKGLPAGHAHVVRELTIPVLRAGRVCAVLGVGNKPSDYDDADIADVSTLADLAWDIAARKRAEEALALSEARYRGLFDTMMDGLVVVEMDGTIRESNETYRKMLGYTAEELRLRTYAQLTPERWHAAEAKVVAEQVLPRGFSEVYEKEYRRKDGSVFPVELRTFLLREHGRPSAMWAIVRDVTERKQSELATRRLHDEVQRERDLLSALLESMGDEVWFADNQGRFVLANPSALSQFGMAAADGVDVEEMARSLEVLRADGTPRPVAEAPPLRALHGEVVVNQEELVRTTATGELRNRQVSAAPVRDRQGKAIGSVSVVRDVTDRRRAEAALRASEQRYRDLVELSPDAIFVNRAGRVEFVNQAAVSLFGAGHADPIVGRSALELFHPDSHALVRERIRTLLAGSKVPVVRERVLRLDGSTREVEVAAALFHDERGLAIQVVLHDVTEQMRREAALQASEEHFRELVRFLPIPIAFSDPAGRIVTLNDRFTHVLGYTPEDIPTLDEWFTRAHPDAAYRRQVVERWSEAFRNGAAVGGEVAPEEYWVTTKDGDVRAMLISGVPVGENLLVAFVDVTRRKQAEEALRQSERRFRLLAQELSLGIFQAGPDGRMAFVNPAWCALTGLTEKEAYASDPWKTLHREDRDWVARDWWSAVDAGRSFTAEYRNELPDGRQVWVRSFATPIRDEAGTVSGYVGALVDITEPRALQAKVALSSRLAAMGTLVAGVAHEVNNPLAAGMADQGIALELAREVRDRILGSEPVDRPSEARLLGEAIEALEEAQESAQRISRIVKNLTAFGRPDPRRRRLRLADVVAEAMRWMPASVALVAQVTVEDGGAPEVVASSGQLEQVVVNLVTNAAKAMPEGKRGRVLVRTGAGGPGMSRLEVVDDGRGIEPAIQERIFEPFFTTRPAGPGRGMGLGLAICHAIVTSHGGTLTVTSTAGKGSTFRMELPVAPPEA